MRVHRFNWRNAPYSSSHAFLESRSIHRGACRAKINPALIVPRPSESRLLFDGGVEVCLLTESWMDSVHGIGFHTFLCVSPTNCLNLKSSTAYAESRERNPTSRLITPKRWVFCMYPLFLSCGPLRNRTFVFVAGEPSSTLTNALESHPKFISHSRYFAQPLLYTKTS